MKTRAFITLISFSFLSLLINGCGDNEHSSHYSGGSGDMNFEQQALRMEQEDLAKLKLRGGSKSEDFAKIHKGVEGVTMAKDPNDAIALVNGEPILRLELDMILIKVKQRMGSKRLHLVEERIIDDLVSQLVLKQFIRKENIHIDPSRIEEEIKAFRENIGNNPDTKDKTLETLLEEQGGSIAELRVAMDISLSIDEYLNRTIPEEEIKKYFTENIGVFSGETVTASHILIDTRKIKDEEGLNQAKEKIGKLKEELDNGADFEKLAKENSDCPSAGKGGGLGVIVRGQMVEEFEKTAFNTEVNGISEPVKTKFGYHIIKITDKQEGKDIRFDDKIFHLYVARSIFEDDKTKVFIKDMERDITALGGKLAGTWESIQKDSKVEYMHKTYTFSESMKEAVKRLDNEVESRLITFLEHPDNVGLATYEFEETKDNVKLALFNEKTITLIQGLKDNADVKMLYKPTPYASSGGHGSMAHGSTMYGGSSAHGGSMPTGHGNPAPHAGMPMPGGSSYGGGDPHGGGSSPHGGAMSSTE